MGKLLGKMGVSPDLIISSPAKRTKETISIILEEIHFRETISYDENIYESSADELLNIIKIFDEKLKRVLLVGHNPSLTDLANYLSKDKIDNIPTCGFVGLTFNCSWRDLSQNCCDTIFFEYPTKNATI
jgi:phosphohistidine phosphatase